MEVTKQEARRLVPTAAPMIIPAWERNEILKCSYKIIQHEINNNVRYFLDRNGEVDQLL